MSMPIGPYGSVYVTFPPKITDYSQLFVPNDPAKTTQAVRAFFRSQKGIINSLDKCALCNLTIAHYSKEYDLFLNGLLRNPIKLTKPHSNIQRLKNLLKKKRAKKIALL